MKYVSALVQQYQSLKGRERLLAIAAALALLYFIVDFSLLGPQEAQAKTLRAKIAQQQTELASFTAALQTLSAPAQGDPLAKQRAERDELRTTFAEVESVILRASSDARIGDLIRAMVAARPGLTMVALKTLPVQNFVKGTEAAASGAAVLPGTPASAAMAPIPFIYKHGIEVTVQGSYQVLLPYLQGLERSGKGIFWGDVKLDVAAYPQATLKITVYTLSSRPELPLS